jgi:CBS domain-containing protein
VGGIAEAVTASPYGFALVVAADGTLLGRLRRSAIEGDPAATAEAAMEPGPSTVRPDTELADLRERLDSRGFRTAIVSTPEGRLIGVVTRDALDG